MRRIAIVLLGAAPLLAAGAQDVPVRNWPVASAWWVPSVPEREAGGRPSAHAEAPSSASAALPFFAITPCRMADTRPSGGFVGQYGPPALVAGQNRSFDVAGQCGIPPQAQAVSFNFTVTNTQGYGDLRLYPYGGAAPLVSTLNYVPAQTIPNAAIVPLGGPNGTIVALPDVSGADLVIDVNGYFAPQGFVSAINGVGGSVALNGSSSIQIAASGSAFTWSLALPLTISYPSPTGVGVIDVTNTAPTEGGGISGTGYTRGVAGYSVGTSGAGVLGSSSGVGGSGVYGIADSGVGTGVSGAAPTRGVAGRATQSSGDSSGVVGIADSSDLGHGVYGTGTFGVFGLSKSASSFPASTIGAAGVWGDSYAYVGVYGTSETNMGVAGASKNAYGVYCVGRGGYTQSWDLVSDRRLKKDVATLVDSLARVLALRGVSFAWRRDEFPEKNFAAGRQVGFIAQEIEQVVPEVVDTTPDGFRAVDYAKLTPLLVEAVKAQQEEIRALRAELEDLRARRRP